MDGEVIRRADYDELACTFDKVKAPPLHLSDQCSATNFTLHVADGAPHDTTFLCGLGAEQLMKEGRVPGCKAGCAKLDLSHAVT